MYQTWHHLLFLHWPVAPEQLRPLIPAGLDLDLFEGRAYVGLTPFTMTGVRPVGIPPFPLVSDFHETNVRTYVHRAGRDPGVWFFSLDASNAPAVLAARLVLGLPYQFARIRFAIAPEGVPSEGATTGQGPIIDYALERRWPGPTPATCTIRYAARGPAGWAQPGSLEFFLVERYILYSVWAGRLYRGRIHHPPWSLQAADVPALNETLLAAVRIVRPDTSPLAHYARRQDVAVFRTERVAAKGAECGPRAGGWSRGSQPARSLPLRIRIGHERWHPPVVRKSHPWPDIRWLW
jgi:uncharacterized protein YqjF (DUF2071 family)